MKKRNLAILLVIPFLVAMFGIVTINTAFNLIDNDVIRINWSYRDNELFQIGKQISLKAEGVVADKRYPASAGNRLVWTVENSDGAEDAHAETITDGRDNWFLKTMSEGRVIITCSTEKGNVTPVRMNGYIYKDNAFVINTKINGSGQNVDSIIYYGEYDLNNGEKQRASFDFDLTVSTDEILNGIKVDREKTSPNLSVDLDGGKITINGTNDGICNVVLQNSELGVSTTFSFKVVEDGVNVYTYQDLLDCTNNSEKGEIVVLRKNFESKGNAETYVANNVTVFGTPVGSGFNFKDEVYSFATTYNREYIDQWNAFSANGSSFKPIGDVVLAGLRIQKDFYGNGYTLNMHNLCFPATPTTVTDPNGNTYDIYKPGENDLFKGPKPFYLLGDPNSSLPLVTVYGQDNSGMYIDGNNITVNDVKVKNCDFGLVVENLNYAGTVVEVNGNGNIIKNSVLSNGKNVLRSFSSMNLTVDNCILSTSRNFLLSVGSNKYEKNDISDTKTHTFTMLDGSKFTGTLSSYLSGDGDKLLNTFTAGFESSDDIMNGKAAKYDPNTEKAQMKAAIHSLQSGLNCEDRISSNNIDGSCEVTDTIFYRSGIASIGIDTMFNGPFLYNNSPTIASGIFSLFGSLLETAIPMFPNNISGSSYPVSVNISGNTKFYDYKTLEEWDISGLIDQNISELINGLGLLDKNLNITIDDIFPLKEILTSVARRNSLLYKANGSDYINIPIAYYGGGRNLSVVSTDRLTAGGLTGTYDVDLLDRYLNMHTTLDLSGGLSSILSDPNFMRYMKEVLTKTVTTVTGFEAFKFQFDNNPDEVFDTVSGMPLVPNYQDLIKA